MSGKADADAIVVGFVGRLQALKAPDVMVNAVARLRQLNPELADRIRMVIVGGQSGTGKDYPRLLRQLTRDRGLTDAVRFIPPRSGDELADVRELDGAGDEPTSLNVVLVAVCQGTDNPERELAIPIALVFEVFVQHLDHSGRDRVGWRVLVDVDAKHCEPVAEREQPKSGRQDLPLGVRVTTEFGLLLLHGVKFGVNPLRGHLVSGHPRRD